MQAIWFSGQFHGVIMPKTPTGSRMTTAVPIVLLELIVRQRSRVEQVAEAGGGLQPSAIGSGAPISSEMAAPMSCMRRL